MNESISTIDQQLDEKLASDKALQNEVAFNFGLTKAAISKYSSQPDWNYWLSLPSWNPYQATCLLYGTCPDESNEKKVRDILIRALRNAEPEGSMTPYQWVTFWREQGLPLSHRLDELKPEMQTKDTEINNSVIINDNIKANNNPLSEPSIIGKRDNQVAIICEIAEKFNYDLLNIPEEGKAKIKMECLKKDLFTKSAFFKAWIAAGKRGKIRIKDKEKYL